MLIISYRSPREEYYGNDRETFPGSCEIKVLYSLEGIKTYIASRLKLYLEHDHYHVILDNLEEEVSIDDLVEYPGSIRIPGKSKYGSIITKFQPGEIYFPESFDQAKRDDLLNYLCETITGKIREDEEKEARRMDEEKKKAEEQSKIWERQRKEALFEQLKQELGK